MTTTRRRCRCPRGVSLVEVLVIVAVVAITAMIFMMVLPRQRETARTVGCVWNLERIGVGLALYHQANGRLPTVPVLGGPDQTDKPSPLAAILADLGQDDTSGMTDLKKPPARLANPRTGERRVPVFICVSDPNAGSGLLSTPINYRANTGDLPSGKGGPFEPGRLVSLEDVAAGDGLSYTAGFSERLAGNTQPTTSWLGNYAIAPAPLRGEACPPAPPAAVRADAGDSWTRPSWRNTLYNHSLTPNASSSCIADDGGSAFMGASSGHLNRVHVLTLDGGVRPYTSQVDAGIWRKLATIKDRD